MGDQDRGQVHLALQATQLPPQLGPDRSIQGGERFVEQHHVGVAGQRPGQAHPLTLPAGELLGPAVEEIVEMEGLQPPGGPGRVRMGSEALRDIADPASLGRDAAHVGPAVGDGPGPRSEQPGQDSQGDRFPRA
jgi:hypothetical protein